MVKPINLLPVSPGFAIQVYNKRSADEPNFLPTSKR